MLFLMSLPSLPRIRQLHCSLPSFHLQVSLLLHFSLFHYLIFLPLLQPLPHLLTLSCSPLLLFNILLLYLNHILNLLPLIYHNHRIPLHHNLSTTYLLSLSSLLLPLCPSLNQHLHHIVLTFPPLLLLFPLIQHLILHCLLPLFLLTKLSSINSPIL
jgi:hypothetical protein